MEARGPVFLDDEGEKALAGLPTLFGLGSDLEIALGLVQL
jgi:hypothetical protein